MEITWKVFSVWDTLSSGIYAAPSQPSSAGTKQQFLLMNRYIVYTHFEAYWIAFASKIPHFNGLNFILGPPGAEDGITGDNGPPGAQGKKGIT